MTKITSTIWSIEPHTEAKHEILRKYLDAWLPIITEWNGMGAIGRPFRANLRVIGVPEILKV